MRRMGMALDRCMVVWPRAVDDKTILVAFRADQASACRLLRAPGLVFSQRNSHMMISLVVALTLASNNKGQPVDSPITQAKKMVLISIARMNWLIFSDTAPVLPER